MEVSMTDSRICIALDFKSKVEVKEFLEKFNDEKLEWNYFMVKELK